MKAALNILTTDHAHLVESCTSKVKQTVFDPVSDNLMDFNWYDTVLMREDDGEVYERNFKGWIKEGKAGKEKECLNASK